MRAIFKLRILRRWWLLVLLLHHHRRGRLIPCIRRSVEICVLVLAPGALVAAAGKAIAAAAGEEAEEAVDAC